MLKRRYSITRLTPTSADTDAILLAQACSKTRSSSGVSCLLCPLYCIRSIVWVSLCYTLPLRICILSVTKEGTAKCQLELYITKVWVKELPAHRQILRERASYSSDRRRPPPSRLKIRRQRLMFTRVRILYA